MEVVDDLLTFADLGQHLRSHGCHVANLSSCDFSPKNGINGAIKSLLRKFLMVTLDVRIINDLSKSIGKLIFMSSRMTLCTVAYICSLRIYIF